MELVGIDIDDVMADFNSVLQPWHNRMYGTSLTREEIVDYDLWNIWGCTEEEAIRRVHEFYKTRDFQRGILPVEGSQSGVLKLAQRSDLVSVTSRSVEIGRETKAWVERYFPSMFLGVCFTNAFSLEGERRKKVDVCRELGVKIIIEDSPTIARACYGAGMGVVLLDAPWNRQVDLPEGVVRVNDWGGDC